MGMEIFYNKEMYILLRIEHLIKLNLIMGLLRLEKLWYFCFFFFFILLQGDVVLHLKKKKSQIEFTGCISIILCPNQELWKCRDLA